MTLEGGIPVHQAAIRLSLNYSTAKLIVRNYRRTGKIPVGRRAGPTQELNLHEFRYQPEELMIESHR
jgi:transposase